MECSENYRGWTCQELIQIYGGSFLFAYDEKLKLFY